MRCKGTAAEFAGRSNLLCPHHQLSLSFDVVGAGVDFLKGSAPSFPQLSYGLLPMGQLEWAKQKAVGPLLKIQRIGYV